MSVMVLYKTIGCATGGRDGEAGTLDGSFHVSLSTPVELNGQGGTGVNPEQLFACGYAACFLGALKVAAPDHGIILSEDSVVSATVGIGPRDGGGFGLTVGLEIDLPGVALTGIGALVAHAHEICPYSNATRNNIDVQLRY